MAKLSVSVPDELWSITTAVYRNDTPSRIVQDALRAYLREPLGFYPTDDKIKDMIVRGVQRYIEREPEGEQGELWKAKQVASG